MPNRLSEELSPYLLQHRNNPVDWYPWGEEAFQKAKAENKPVFLSIGYATCHWCHVMEHESFEDEEVAALMNEAFVSIKVDREERPDIDQIYMAYCQLSTGHGGWPLTIIMTPEKKPFFAATYIPKQTRYNRMGMTDLIPRVREIWNMKREDVLESADQNVDVLNKMSSWEAGSLELDEDTLDACYRQLRDNYDPQHGGFGDAPKFPSPHQLIFLLRYGFKRGIPEAVEMVEFTLKNMSLGGLFDHIGYGLHRYSTDRVWLLPHFEKMLYDQAMVVLAATEAYEQSGDPVYGDLLDKVITYVLRDMTSPEGAFYSAEDADSEGVEGKFYVWSIQELRTILGAEKAKLFIDTYQVREEGNFIEEATGRRTGDNILHLKATLDTLPPEQREVLEQCRRLLFQVRENRVHPLKDDKVLTDWNGLMIAALARYARVFDNQRVYQQAARTAEFIRSTLYIDGKGLLHRYREGNAGLQANLDDYAFLVWGLIELYQAGFDRNHLTWALELQDLTIEKFWDAENGGFFFSPFDGEPLIARNKEVYDGATPSGNSVALSNLLRLGRLTGRTEYEEKADRILRWFAPPILNHPSGFTAFLSGLSFSVGPAHEIVIVGQKGQEDTEVLLRVIRETYLPESVLLLKEPDDDQVAHIAPFTEYMKALNGRAAVYVCQNYQCNQPLDDPAALRDLLRSH